MTIKTVLITLLLSWRLHADAFGLGHWTIEVEKSSGSTILKISDRKTSELLFQYENDDSAEIFESAESLFFEDQGQKFILTKWSNGAHAQDIRIIDVKAKSVVFNESFGWPPGIEILGNQVKFKFKKNNPESTGPREIKDEMTWSPSGPKSPGSNSQ